MPFAICLAGEASPEKTEFVNDLAAQLEARQVKVGFVRRQAPDLGAVGARVNLDISQDGTMCLLSGGVAGVAGASLEELLGRYFAGLDLVICQGFEGEKRPKVEWLPRGGKPSLARDPGLRAVVSAQAVETDKAVYAPGDAAGLAAFLASEVIPKSQPPRMRMVLDGKRIPIKEFVQDILANTIRAMVASLKGGDRPGRLEIYIEPDEE